MGNETMTMDKVQELVEALRLHAFDDSDGSELAMPVHIASIAASLIEAQQAEIASRSALFSLLPLDDEGVEKARTAWLESASDYTRLDVSIAAALTAYINHLKGE